MSVAENDQPAGRCQEMSSAGPGQEMSCTETEWATDSP